MISGGKTNLIKPLGAGRELLCLEDISKPATSQCAKTLGATITAAERGLDANQKRLWQKFVYQPAVKKVERFCNSKPTLVIPGTEDDDDDSAQKQSDKNFVDCVMKVLKGQWKFEGLRKQKHLWVRYLNDGASEVKKLTSNAPVNRSGSRNRAAE